MSAQRGTNVSGWVEAASALGFACKGVKAGDDVGELSIDRLKKVPKSTIAHIVYKKQLTALYRYLQSDG